MKIENIENLDEYFDADTIMQRMLNNISNQVDKREGSIIYDAIAPCAAEIAQLYILLKYNIDLVFADTAPDEYLDKLANQIGITRNIATAAVKKGCFYDENEQLMDIALNQRFTIGELVFKTIEKIETGIYKMECETAGIVGNSAVGDLIPIDYIQYLAKAELTDLLIPGEDEENDDSLRLRYYSVTSEQGFGGNVVDYKNKTNEIHGVGGVKVTPIWNGPGTVKLTILDSNYDKASKVLISEVQNIMCPDMNSEGLGVAPIGHVVTVDTVTEAKLSISTTVVMAEGTTQLEVQAQIETLINKYFLELKQNWEDTDKIIIRKAQIETLILSAPGVIDVSNTTINNKSGNIELGEFEIPILQGVVVS